MRACSTTRRPVARSSGTSPTGRSSVEGTSELIGPDDPADGIDADGLRLLLRAVFAGAGGSHDDWDTYDRVMREERRVAVLIEPTRVYGTYS
jgi:hypothetical protein